MVFVETSFPRGGTVQHSKPAPDGGVKPAKIVSKFIYSWFIKLFGFKYFFLCLGIRSHHNC